MEPTRRGTCTGSCMPFPIQLKLAVKKRDILKAGSSSCALYRTLRSAVSSSQPRWNGPHTIVYSNETIRVKHSLCGGAKSCDNKLNHMYISSPPLRHNEKWRRAMRSMPEESCILIALDR